MGLIIDTLNNGFTRVVKALGGIKEDTQAIKAAIMDKPVALSSMSSAEKKSIHGEQNWEIPENTLPFYRHRYSTRPSTSLEINVNIKPDISDESWKPEAKEPEAEEPEFENGNKTHILGAHTVSIILNAKKYTIEAGEHVLGDKKFIVKDFHKIKPLRYMGDFSNGHLGGLDETEGISPVDFISLYSHLLKVLDSNQPQYIHNLEFLKELPNEYILHLKRLGKESQVLEAQGLIAAWKEENPLIF